MTLQQMRYLLAIAEHGSISGAAHSLYVSQSSLSEAVREVEREMGVTVFNRSSRGVEVTLEGRELLSLAKQVVQQDDLLNSRFGKNGSRSTAERFAVSAQHYSIGVDAFSDFVKDYAEDAFAFTYRETRTEEVIDDVKNLRSHIGLLFICQGNERIIRRALDLANLTFTPLFETKPQALMSANHALAKRSSVSPADLTDLPFISFEQGANDSLFYSEEPLAEVSHRSTITVRDRSTMISLLANGNGYTIASGAHSRGMDYGIVGVPVKTSERMQVGYISSTKFELTKTTLHYIDKLKERVELLSLS